MDCQVFKLAAIFYCALMMANGSVIRGHNNGQTEIIERQEELQMSALYDHQTGVIFYKDEETGACLVDNVGNSGLKFMKTLIIRNENKSHTVLPNPFIEDITNSTLAKVFCGKLPIHEIPNLLHVFAEVEAVPLNYLNNKAQLRQRRSVGNGNHNQYPSQHWPNQGPASQTQIQGQVTGQGFFSGQAQSQHSGHSQSQVQLAGTGILGSLSSSAGNAQAQIALGSVDGSGQAASSGVGPSNSQVQVNLGQQGRGSMASASVLAGQGGQIIGGNGAYGRNGHSKFIQTGYSGRSSAQSYNDYEKGGALIQPQQSTNGLPGSQLYHGGYDQSSSHRYNGHGTETGQAIDQLSQIYPSQGYQNSLGNFQNGHPSRYRPSVGTDLSGHHIQPSTGSHFVPVNTIGREISQPSVGTNQQHLTSGYSEQGNIISQPTAPSNEDLGNSIQNNRDFQAPSGDTRGRPISHGGGTMTYPSNSQRHRYQQSGSNRQTSPYERGTYSPQHQSHSSWGVAGSRPPQSFASSYGGGQAQAQTVYLGPGTSDFYSPGRGSYTSSYASNERNSNREGNGYTGGTGNNGHIMGNDRFGGNGYISRNGHVGGNVHAGGNGNREGNSYPRGTDNNLHVVGNENVGGNGQAGGNGNRGGNGYYGGNGHLGGNSQAGRNGQTGGTGNGGMSSNCGGNNNGGRSSNSKGRGNGSCGGNSNDQSQIHHTTYDSVSQGRTTATGHRTNGNHQATSYANNIPSNGHIDQLQSTQNGLVRPYISSNEDVQQPIRQNNPNEYVAPYGPPDPTSVPFRPPDQIGTFDQGPGGSTFIRPSVTNGQIVTPHYQPDNGSNKQHQIPISGHGPRGQSQQSTYVQPSIPVGYPGTISSFLQRPQEQDGFAPSYGISQPSPYEAGSQRCTIVTFTCTIIIESNGRAKICRPNMGQANGSNGGGSTTQTMQNTGGICCC